MTKRLNNKYKIVNFYKEDLWGKLGVNTYKPVKINSILLEKPIERFKFKLEIQYIKNRLFRVYGINKKFMPFRYQKYVDPIKYKKLKNYNRKLYIKFKIYKNKQYKKYKKALKENIKLYKDTRARPSFNFRTDIGKPKRKKKRLKLFSKKLKNRHKLRKFFSGTMSIKQLRNYVYKVHHYSSLTLFFLKFLETRIDFLIYRLSISKNSGEIRQMLNHGNFLKNGKQVFFANQSLDIFDVFSFKNKEFFFNKLLSVIKHNLLFFSVPRYLEVNFRIMSIVIFRNPLSKHIYYPTETKPLYLASSGFKFRKK